MTREHVPHTNPESAVSDRTLAGDPEAVSRALQHFGEAVDGPLSIERMGVGQSNITSKVTDETGRRWVLREPPPTRGSSSAHDVHREARIMTALRATDIPVPEVIGADVGPGGAPFMLMELVPGTVLETEEDAGTLPTEERRSLGIEVIDVLAALHRLDPDEVGLGDLGPRSSYIARQTRRITELWNRTGIDSSYHGLWDEVRATIESDPPALSTPTIVHGDYRLSNLLVQDGRIRSVLDWELATIGEPLADLAWLLDDWIGPGEPTRTMPSPTRVGGFPGREELVDRYRKRTGISVARLDRYRGFSRWRAASLLQGVLARRRAGVMGDHGALDLEDLERTIEEQLISARRHLERDQT